MKTKKINNDVLHDNPNKPLSEKQIKTIHTKRIVALSCWAAFFVICLVAMILVFCLIKKK